MTFSPPSNPPKPVFPRIPSALIPEPTKSHRPKGMIQAYVIRDVAANTILEMQTVIAQDLDDYSAKSACLERLVTVWDKCCDRIRVMRGQPDPGRRRPAPEPRKALTRKPGRMTPVSPAPTEQPVQVPTSMPVSPAPAAPTEKPN